MKTRKTDQYNSIEKLSNKELLRRLDLLNQKERETTLSVLLHLNEVEKRRLYLREGYNSLFDYCTRRLRYSESSANRRIRTARCIRDYPEIYGMISGGEINLCTVSRIAGILRKDNKNNLLREVRGRSIRDYRYDCLEASSGTDGQGSCETCIYHEAN